MSWWEMFPVVRRWGGYSDWYIHCFWQLQLKLPWGREMTWRSPQIGNSRNGGSLSCSSIGILLKPHWGRNVSRSRCWRKWSHCAVCRVRLWCILVPNPFIKVFCWETTPGLTEVSPEEMELRILYSYLQNWMVFAQLTSYALTLICLFYVFLHI